MNTMLDLLWKFGARAWFATIGVALAGCIIAYRIEVLRERRGNERWPW